MNRMWVAVFDNGTAADVGLRALRPAFFGGSEPIVPKPTEPFLDAQ